MSDRNTYIFQVSRIYTKHFEVEADSYEEACDEAQDMVFNDGDRDLVDGVIDYPERTELSYSGYEKRFKYGSHPVIGYPDRDDGSDRLDEDTDAEYDWPRLLYRRWEGDDRLYEF